MNDLFLYLAIDTLFHPSGIIQTVSYLYFCNPIVLESVDVTENHDLRHPHIQYPTKVPSSEFVATVNNQFGLLKIKEIWNNEVKWLK